MLLLAKKAKWPLVLIWGSAFIGLVQSELQRSHLGLNQDWLMMSFYYSIPAALWSFFLYVAVTRSRSVSIQVTWSSIVHHFCVGILLAVIVRVGSLIIDFEIKGLLFGLNGSLADFLTEIRFLLLSAILSHFILYLLIVAIIHFQGGPMEKFVTAPAKFILIRDDEHIERVPHHEVVCIEAFGNYVKVHTQSKTFCTRSTFKAITANIDNGQFCKVHRSVMVNRNHIRSLNADGTGSYRVEMINRSVFPVNKKYFELIRRTLFMTGLN